MIDGCLDWQKNGLMRPQVVKEATEEYFDDQNTMAQWLEKCCEVDMKNFYLASSSNSLFQSWSGFAKSNGVDPGTSKTFKPALEKMGFKFKKDMRGRWFHGLQLRNDDENDGK